MSNQRAESSLTHEVPSSDGRSGERFENRRGRIVRSLQRRDGQVVRSSIAQSTSAADGPTTPDLAEQAWLRSTHPIDDGELHGEIRSVDLFSGCGGLSIGVAEAARALGMRFNPLLAVDFEADALDVFKSNFPEASALHADITQVFDGEVGARVTSRERLLAARTTDVDVLLGGPPCQGHSDFNNRTRHDDEKNALYRRMVRAAEVLQPANILIENVPGALKDRSGVVQRTASDLLGLGYNVSLAVVDLSRLGVPQRRRRLVLLGSRENSFSANELEQLHARDERNLAWAIADLAGRPTGPGASLIDRAANSAPQTRERINYLFRNDLNELPDSERPECHASGTHSYKSIYGRLAWGEPTQTITTGFYSMCMGRYVHPSERRTLTAHEAARVQYIPDWFSFGVATSRTSLAKMIGNAVPSRLSYAVALEWLR